MTNKEIVDKLWNLCHVLRDDGITYHQYVTELTYILFLKMAKETGNENDIPEKYRWDKLVKLEGIKLKDFYRKLLFDLGKNTKGKIQHIYKDAITNIDEPKNLAKIIKNINELDWFDALKEKDGLGDLYEGLLEKNAQEKKSGAGQYFTPRPLIKVMVELINPRPGERCNDPACGTFGFMVMVDKYLKDKTSDYYDLLSIESEWQRKKAFSGCELVRDTHRLALMNAILHGIDGEIKLGDTLSLIGESLKNYDVVLSNPPFGTKKGGERPTRDDLTISTSNKQLNFLQHIYRSLRKDTGTARAAVILPDNVLFQDGDGQKIRVELMDKCELHTILRLPTGIFYAQGVKTNVLFFRRGKTEKDNTKEVWFYDMRTGLEALGKRNPIKYEHFADFIKVYNVEDRNSIKNERWRGYSREEIASKKDSLDLGLIFSSGKGKVERQKEPIKLMQDAKKQLGAIIMEINAIVKELNNYGK